MEISKIQAMLRTADPQNGAGTEERENALRMAQREMKKQGISYASLGFDYEEAVRIENQFSISNAKSNGDIAKSTKNHRASKPSSSNRNIGTRSSISSKQEKEVQPQGESYIEYCERMDHEDFLKWHEASEAARREEKEIEEKYNKIAGIVLILVLGAGFVFIGFVLYSSGIVSTVAELVVLAQQIIAGIVLIGFVMLVVKFFKSVFS